jgi:hypothetical protein
MGWIEAFYLEDRTTWIRWLVVWLVRDGLTISRDRVRNLLWHMALRVICQKPRLAPRCRANHQSAFPAWLMSEPSQLKIRSGTDIPLRKGFFFSGGSCGSVVQARAQLEAFKQP